MSAESYQQQLEKVNSKLDQILDLLHNGYMVEDTHAGNGLWSAPKPVTPPSNLPSYTGSREADYVLDEAYANNEPIGDVIKRHAKAKKSKVGKDLDNLDNIVDRTSEVGVTRGESENFLDSTAGDGYNDWMESTKAGEDRDGI
tara:strand:+ start:83 stop:511 length:429 start_codon:yes stop_codon:yes gene_type:complete